MELFTVELTDLQAFKLREVIKAMEERKVSIPLMMQVAKDGKAIKIHLPDPKQFKEAIDTPCKGCGECDTPQDVKPLNIHPGTETLQ